MNRLNTITLFLLLILNNFSITLSFAEDGDIRYYDVEIVIFENTRTKYQQSEHWKKNYNQIEPESFVQIGQPLPINFPEQYDPLLSFQYIENTDYRLNDIVTSLNESSLHRILLHSAWRQPGMSNSEAINVKINHLIPTENAFINQSSREISESDQYNDENNNLTNLLDENQDNNSFVLSGYIKLVLSRYLHLKVDLIYHELKSEITEQFINDEFGEDNLLPDIFQIVQNRRLRSKELHYFDHPIISIIALVTPYEVKEQVLIDNN